jgi:serine/threonine-protein kinase SRPK3
MHAPPDSSDSESDSENMSSDDECKKDYRKGGYHPVVIGEVYNKKYIIEKKLGFGYFSTVWLASDRTKSDDDPHKMVAIKFQKSANHYREAAEDEIKLLSQIHDRRSPAKQFIVTLLDKFMVHGPHGKHMCMVFEVMWKDLLFIMKKFDYRGLPVPILKNICYQILCGLELMHDKCKIIHTDLKPENFLISLPRSLDIGTLQAERRQFVKLNNQTSLEESIDKMRSRKLNKNQKRRLRDKLKRLKKKRQQQQEEQQQQQQQQQQEPKQEPKQQAQIHQQSPQKPPPRIQECKNDETKAAGVTQPSTSPSAPVADKATLTKMKEPDYKGCPNPFLVKIADLGNGCWTHKHFTDDVTTRQYRSPEVILGAEYDTAIDMFSCGTMFYELATGDYLFNPEKNKNGTDEDRNEKHLAKMIEVLGPLPRSVVKYGIYTKNYYGRNGKLRHYPNIKARNLPDLLRKATFPETEIEPFADFLLKLMKPNPDIRIKASQAKMHPWLASVHRDYQNKGIEAFAFPDFDAELKQFYEEREFSDSEEGSSEDDDHDHESV